MRFYLCEQEAFDELGASETVGDIVRIGFNRVDVEDTDGKTYNCYDIVGDKVRGEAWDYDKKETIIKWFDNDTPIDQYTISIDRDEDQYTIISVKVYKEKDNEN